MTTFSFGNDLIVEFRLGYVECYTAVLEPHMVGDHFTNDGRRNVIFNGLMAAPDQQR